MQTPPPNEITQLLRRWSQGDPDALDHMRRSRRNPARKPGLK